jgi:hypothetical protein
VSRYKRSGVLNETFSVTSVLILFTDLRLFSQIISSFQFQLLKFFTNFLPLPYLLYTPLISLSLILSSKWYFVKSINYGAFHRPLLSVVVFCLPTPVTWNASSRILQLSDIIALFPAPIIRSSYAHVLGLRNLRTVSEGKIHLDAVFMINFQLVLEFSLSLALQATSIRDSISTDI